MRQARRDIFQECWRAQVLARWVYRALRADLLPLLVTRWFVVGVALVQLDVIVDFTVVAREITRLPPLGVGAAVAVLLLAISAGDAGVVRRTLLGPRLAVLRRQPLAGPTWGPAALVAVAPLGSWLAAPIGLVHQGPSAAALWCGLLVLPTIAFAARRPAVAVVGCGAGGALAGLAQAWPALAPVLAAGVWVGAVPLAGCATEAWGADAAGERLAPGPGRPRTVVAALLHRDLLLLWRTEAGLVRGAALGIGLAAPAWAMVHTGEWDALSVSRGVLVGLALLSPLVLAAPSAVARRLGRRLDPPEWPVTSWQRALTLAAVGSLALAPGWAAAAVAAPPIGAHHGAIGAFVAAMGAGAAMWVAARPTRPNPGTWWYWLAICLAAAWSWPWGVAAAAALAGAAGWRAAALLGARRGRP